VTVPQVGLFSAAREMAASADSVKAGSMGKLRAYFQTTQTTAKQQIQLEVGYIFNKMEAFRGKLRAYQDRYQNPSHPTDQLKAQMATVLIELFNNKDFPFPMKVALINNFIQQASKEMSHQNILNSIANRDLTVVSLAKELLSLLPLIDVYTQANILSLKQESMRQAEKTPQANFNDAKPELAMKTNNGLIFQKLSQANAQDPVHELQKEANVGIKDANAMIRQVNIDAANQALNTAIQAAENYVKSKLGKANQALDPLSYERAKFYGQLLTKIKGNKDNNLGGCIKAINIYLEKKHSILHLHHRISTKGSADTSAIESLRTIYAAALHLQEVQTRRAANIGGKDFLKRQEQESKTNEQGLDQAPTLAVNKNSELPANPNIETPAEADISRRPSPGNNR
jgi:ElaB/YqjD/DUF883 family membrane-anchored ribosome-binding protein